MADIKMINNYNIKDETARNEIENLRGEIPANISELNNDAGYLTEHQSLEGLASEQYVNDAIGDIEIPTVPTNVSDFNNDAGYLIGEDLNKYATQDYVADAIANIEIPDEPDLSGLATKDELNDAIGDINAILDNINGEEV